jgi:hypothetical protein
MARKVYGEGNKSMKNNNKKEERLMLLESWRDMEVSLLILVGAYQF